MADTGNRRRFASLRAAGVSRVYKYLREVFTSKQAVEFNNFGGISLQHRKDVVREDSGSG
ncbi:hypothetical protein PILCRDRAFT_816199 [Piloderma croceum F 1598]|uniref:Uncharacterized protein n=1 Tax=Piloderma croceum (strain F 1598) TaxID=765440 RepID=A0A0C3FQ56_PILCF|nr:hypothetical protein PILCRDRAFT_816199 [Piloderma croceum F 1598]